MKPKIKKTKLSFNPFFIKFLNWKKDKYTVEKWLENLADSFTDTSQKQIVIDKEITDCFLDDLINFQKKFKDYVLETIQTQNIKEEFIFWLDNSFKYIKEIKEDNVFEENRSIEIIDKKGRWFEAIICYNFILTFNYFGIRILKICPVCKSFFSHKGQYAKYCSESCKELGKKK